MSKSGFDKNVDPTEAPRLSEYNLSVDASGIVLAIERIKDTRWTRPIQTDPSQRNPTLRITSKLKLCGDNISDYDMLEKTFTAFHVSNMVLQQQYQEKGFTKYSQLISLLLVVERNNELLMRNHENRPTRSTPFPKEDEVYSHYANRGKGRGHIRGRGRGHIQGRKFPGVNHPPPKNNFQKWKGKDEKRNAEGSEIK
uniref:Uncharacterized protein n=1 Tax=Nicotiana tabacum TaxID=4097 RepID=A0A1S4CTE2_TOBAC|nr:PREDICTED: uncharacterized protein LOC107822362 [Nicotiana tabacum]